jgi:CBS domain-containing membrane protein
MEDDAGGGPPGRGDGQMRGPPRPPSVMAPGAPVRRRPRPRPVAVDPPRGRVAAALFNVVNGGLSIGIMAVAALVTGQPFIFPSLGPSAYLFFAAPSTPAAAPRNAVFGHALGAAAGLACLYVFGLADAGPATTVGVTWARVAATALSLGLTNGLMVLLRVPHPPAAATTLIISLGLLSTLEHVAVLLLAVALLTLQAVALNRLAGVTYPWWGVTRAAPPEPS